MTKNEANISRATEADLEGIVLLQAANQPEHGGTLSVNFPASKITEMMCEMPLIVSRRGNSITGFLMTATRATYADVPIINEMLATYPGNPDSYIYGPLCVSAGERGKGHAQAMFSELRRLCQDARAFFLSDAITQPQFAPIRKWECVKSLASYLKGLSVPFSDILGELAMRLSPGG